MTMMTMMLMMIMMTFQLFQHYLDFLFPSLFLSLSLSLSFYFEWLLLLFFFWFDCWIEIFWNFVLSICNNFDDSFTLSSESDSFWFGCFLFWMILFENWFCSRLEIPLNIFEFFLFFWGGLSTPPAPPPAPLSIIVDSFFSFCMLQSTSCEREKPTNDNINKMKRKKN